jgi:hypothetical protein
MGDLVDMTGEEGKAGWFVVDRPHRCSRKFCTEPAVVFHAATAGGYGWSHQARHWWRRYLCEGHMNEYGSGWQVIDGRLMRERYDWESVS